MKRITPFFLTLFLFSGCVLKAKHDETLAKQINCDAELKKVATERDQLTQKAEENRKNF